MSDGGSPATPPSEALSEAELREAFGADLGAGPAPGRSAAPVSRDRPDGDPEEDASGTPVEVAHEGQPTWAELREGWELGIYRDPIVCGALAGSVLGLVGVFVVLRRAVFVTAAVSQAAGLGVGLAFIIDIVLGQRVPPGVGALVIALLAAALLGARARSTRLPREALVGVVYVAASAGAVLVGDRISQESHDVAGILFGTAVLVRPTDLLLVAAVGAITLAFVLASYRGLVFAGFDPEGASVHRLPVRLIEMAFWAVVALEVSVTTRALGALPVFAFAVLPAMAALACVERIQAALALAALFGALAGSGGYVLAFFGELPVGASQAAVATLIVAVAVPFGRRRLGASG